MERTFPRTSEGAGPSQDQQAQVCPAASLKPGVLAKAIQNHIEVPWMSRHAIKPACH